MFKKVLVPVDGSESSWRALQAGKELAEKFAGEVVVLTVTQPNSALSLIVDKHEVNRSNAELQAVSEKILSLAKLKLGDLSNKAKFVLEAGHPAESIIAGAKKNGCDCIVIGRRGLSGVAEFFLGSVSASVAQQAEIPVVIVK